MTDSFASVARHYTAPDLTRRIAAALAERFPEDQTLGVRDLAPLDQFHTRGLEATADLAAAAGVTAAMRVLDMGCGLGGPARYLAATHGAAVVGIDLSADFIDAATYLARRTALGDRTTFQVGNALDLPFADGSFDLVWMQHVAMNIADRAGLYQECRRVLRTGGKLAVYDVVERGGDVQFPVPWSRTPSTSHLLSAEDTRTVLGQSGFSVVEWRDDSAVALDWFKAQAGAAPTPGLGLAMGPDFPTLARNLARNLLEGRVGILTAVLSRGP